MKKLAYAIIALIAVTAVISCDDTETYAEQKEKERSAINTFIRDSAITVITQAQFEEQGCTTNLDNNEYVLLSSSNVYMQIVREGCGSKIASGETVNVLCRFTEKNILTDSIQLSNQVLAYSSIVEKMSVANSSGTFTGSFTEGLMYTYYGSSVPTGWLVPLTYLNIGRPETADDEIAKVKLIVPHTAGHRYASSGVYPCYYILTYQRGV